MEYQTARPHPALRHIIECYWTMKNCPQGSAIREEEVISDLSMEIFFNFGSSYTRRDIDTEKRLEVEYSHVIGVRTKAIIVSQSGYINVVAVRLNPGGLARLVPWPLHETRHEIIDLPDAVGPSVHRLEQRLAEAVDFGSQVQLLNNWFLNCSEQRGQIQGNSNLFTAITHIVEAHGSQPIHSLCRDLYISQRQLRRIFRRRIGVSPKQFSQIVRFQHALAQLRRYGTKYFKHPQFEQCFFDESHFTKNFKRYSGLTPTEFLEKQLFISTQLSDTERLADFYNTQLKQLS